MLLKDRPRTKYGIDQFAPPHCYELAGKKYTFVMDDGFDYILSFIDDKYIEWNYEGKEPKRETYECLKADDTTYLVFYEIEGAEKREGHTFVIDLQNMLVTRLIARNAENPKDPYINNSYFEFGAILKEDGTTEFKRHSFTDELVGTCVQWNYGGFSTVHVYYCTDFYRITYPRDGSTNPATAEAMDNMVKQLPSADEPATYIKIKENMYFVNITEKNMEKVIGAKGQFRSNAMCFLQNYDRMWQMGRAFGNVTGPDGKDSQIRLSYGAYGKWGEVPQSFFDDPNPYIT